MKTIKLFRSKAAGAFAISACVVAAGAVAHGGTYTWRSSPSSSLWSDPNWNDGTTDGVTWVDDAAAPNNAVFGTSSNKSVRNIQVTRYINDLTVATDGYNIFGSGPLSIAGSVVMNAGSATFDGVLIGGRADGSLHFTASSDWKIAYVYSQYNNQTSTYLDGSIFFAPNNDRAFGVVPGAPAENIFITGTPTLFASGSFAVNANRIIKISSGKYLQTSVGNNDTLTYKCPIIAENTTGYDYSRDTYVTLRNNWKGLVVFDTGVARTNSFGRLLAYTKLKIASGVTTLTGPGGVGTDAHLYVSGNGSGFTDNTGNLTISGGEVYSPQSGYVDVGNYGQVTVTNGGKVYMPSVQWLNGHGSPGRLVIAKDGDFTVNNLRISHAQSAEIFLNEGGVIRTKVLTVDPSKNANCLFRFNGGRLQSLDGRVAFFSSATAQELTEEKANLCTFAVGEKGAVFDLSNGQNLWWTRPLVSDVAEDGGLRKIGTTSGDDILILGNTNRYNGVTSIEGGGVQLRVDNALPPGTTVRLSGNNAYLDAYSFDFASPQRATEQWLGRLEGSGVMKSCSQVHVTNSIAPSVNGTLYIANVCDLRGDYEIAANEDRCGLLEMRGANQSISNLTLKVADFSALDRSAPYDHYQILSAPNGYAGKFALPSDWPGEWSVRYTDTAAYLYVPKGTVIIIR